MSKRRDHLIRPFEWSGRRGSNPRPTAWKAVTLPLSYSRLCGSHRFAESGGQARCSTSKKLQRTRTSLLLYREMPSTSALRATATFTWPAGRTGLPTEARAQRERRLVARGGFEPPKPLGRQIYSLLRLTASLPRRSCRSHVSRARRSGHGTAESLSLAAVLSGFAPFAIFPCGSGPSTPVVLCIDGAGEGI